MRSWLGLLVVVALACDYQPLRIERDGAAAVIVDGARGPMTPPAGARNSCDPVAQGCGGNQRCAVDCTHLVWACAARQLGSQAGQGAVCSLDDDCASIFSCVEQRPPGGVSASRCARYCNSSADCPAGTTCTRLPISCDRATIERRLCVYSR